MIFSDDELTPQKQPKKLRDLTSFSVDEIDTYIQGLKAEIIRAEAELGRKKAYRDQVGNLFKSKGE